jgi:hypothetical protein
VEILTLILGIIGIIFGLFQYLRRNKDELGKARTVNEELKAIEHEEKQKQV